MDAKAIFGNYKSINEIYKVGNDLYLTIEGAQYQAMASGKKIETIKRPEPKPKKEAN